MSDTVEPPEGDDEPGHALDRSSSEMQGATLPSGHHVDGVQLPFPSVVSHTFSHVQEHRGPLPVASEFAGYETTLPGAGDRILKMAEKAQDQAFQLENRYLDQDSDVAKTASSVLIREQWMTFLVAVGALGAALILGLNGHPWPATAVGLGGPVGALAIARRMLSRHSQSGPKRNNDNE